MRRYLLLLISRYVVLMSMSIVVSASLSSSIVAEAAAEDKKAKITDESKEFLELNKKKPGVVTLPSGFQYKVIRQGLGTDRVANDEQEVVVNYLVSKVDNTPYPMWGDEKDEMKMVVGDVIEGWKEAWKLMVEGDKWEIYLPPHLTSDMLDTEYTGEVLICDMELKQIIGPKIPFSQKELDYANKKVAKWDITKINSEIERLQKLVNDGKNVKTNSIDWFVKRLTILRQQRVRLGGGDDGDGTGGGRQESSKEDEGSSTWNYGDDEL